MISFLHKNNFDHHNLLLNYLINCKQYPNPVFIQIWIENRYARTVNIPDLVLKLIWDLYQWKPTVVQESH